MKKARKRAVSVQAEVDDLVSAQAEGNRTWDKPVRVMSTSSASISRLAVVDIRKDCKDIPADTNGYIRQLRRGTRLKRLAR